MWKTWHDKETHTWAIQCNDEDVLCHVQSQEEADNLVNVMNYYARKETELFVRQRYHA